VTPRLGRGRWRLRLHGEKRYSFLDVGADIDAPAAEVAWRASDAPREIAAGAVPQMRLVNDTSEDRTFIVEASQWSDVALRPGKLLSFPEFRDLFTQEYLADDVQLVVGEQTILFTDLVGSTAMYAERGDPAAFVEVKRHFTEVFALIRSHRGALVKTIGDAAMGAFCDPLDAVRAAHAIQLAFGPTGGVRLRVSIHSGPCLAVKLNADIDYFGNTVNLAAKLQALADAGEIAVSEATYAAPGVATWLASEGAVLEEIHLEHKAFPAPVAARRWSPGVRARG
jgi:class 3 adenylate cyclase